MRRSNNKRDVLFEVYCEKEMSCVRVRLVEINLGVNKVCLTLPCYQKLWNNLQIYELQTTLWLWHDTTSRTRTKNRLNMSYTFNYQNYMYTRIVPSYSSTIHFTTVESHLAYIIVICKIYHLYWVWCTFACIFIFVHYCKHLLITWSDNATKHYERPYRDYPPHHSATPPR